MPKPERRIGLSALREALQPLARRLSWSKPAESGVCYTILPPYEIPGLIVVTGLLVENRGPDAAHNVRINISYEGTQVAMIHHMQVVSDEAYVLRGGGEQHRFATIRLRQMLPGSKLFVYMATSDTVPPEVRLSTYEKASK